MVKMTRTQKESTSLIALRPKSSIMPKEMGFEEQNIGEKETSEKVLTPTQCPSHYWSTLSCDVINNSTKHPS